MNEYIAVASEFVKANPNVIFAIAAASGILYMIRGAMAVVFNKIVGFFKYLLFYNISIHYSSPLRSDFDKWYDKNQQKLKFNKRYKVVVNNEQEFNDVSITTGYDSKSFYFSREFPVVIFSREKVDKKGIWEETDIVHISILCFSKSKVKKFIEMFRNKEERKENVIYRQEGEDWWNHLGVVREVKVPPCQAYQELSQDVKRFIDAKDDYKSRGIVYKRGILLYGPPGTGKTSMVARVSQDMQLPIYDVDSPHRLTSTLLREMKKPSILLIEDVDMTMIGNSRDLSEEDETKNNRKRKSDPIEEVLKSEEEVFLRKFMNMVDGIVDNSGIILIMTTNDISKLDPAVLRPGRVDNKIYVGSLTPQEQLLYFNEFFGKEYSYIGDEEKRTIAELTNMFNTHSEEEIVEKLALSSLSLENSREYVHTG